MNFKFLVFVFTGFCWVGQSSGQSSGQNYTISPYSNFGLGEVIGTNLAQAGFQGQTFTGSYSYSFTNPATLANLKFTTLDFGLNGRFGLIQSNGQAKTFRGGSLSYLSLGFKTMNKTLPTYIDSAGIRKRKSGVLFKWNSYLALYPSTSIGYNYSVEEGSPFLTRVSHSGKGGINTAEYGASFSLGKHVSAGYSRGYMFGQVTDRSVFSAPDSSDLFFIDDNRTVNVRGFKNQAGLLFEFGKDSSKHRFGLSYKWCNGMKAANQRLTQVFGIQGDNYTHPDTLLNINGSKQKITMPAGFGLGYSYTWRKKITIGLDYYRENWSNYSAYFQPGIRLANRSDYGVNLQFFSSDEKTTKTKKMPPPIRLGARLSNTQNVFTTAGVNTQIQEKAVYFGFGLPITRRYFDNTVLRSILSVRFDYINRGTLLNGLAKEQYFITTLSFNLGDVWFQRRKFD